MSLAQWGYLVLLSVLWGGSFFFVGVVVDDIPPLTLVLCRVGLAALSLLPLIYWLGLSLPRSLSAWWPFAVMAVLNNVVPFTFITLGQKDVASALASVLNATTPLWTVLIAHVFTADEKLTANRIAGVLFGVVGVAILMGPETAAPQRTGLVGMACIIIATISYGFAGLWGRRLRAHPPMVTATAQLICSTLILAPMAMVAEKPWTVDVPGNIEIASIIGLAVLSTALAYIVFFHILAVSGPTNAMLVTLLIPISATALGVLVLDETLTLLQVFGGIVIGAGLLVFDGRLLAWLRRPRLASE